MKQMNLGFETEQDARWEDLPTRTRIKVQEMVGRLIEQAWQRQKREASNEPKNHR